MTVIATVGSGASDTITTSACVSSEGDTIDPKGGNNCSNQTMPVT
jgi:hypothetical protein